MKKPTKAGGPTRPAKGASARAGKRPRSVIARQRQRERLRQRAFVVGAVALALLLVAGVAGWYVYQEQRPEPSAAPPPAGADAGGVKVGTGPVTVDVYLDFMCPHCKDFEESAATTLDTLASSGSATVVYHPLAFLDRYSTTRYSTRSAAAAGCAADAGKFVEYAKVLYANQPPENSAGLDDDKLIELAGTVGIDTGTFGQCVRDGTHASWVDGVTEAATKRDVTGTPTVLVNGKDVDPTPEAIDAAVKAA
jgi:protein-disulfide isomerase